MKIYTNKKLKKEIVMLVEADEFREDYYWHYLFILHHIRTYKLIDKRFRGEEYVPVNIQELRRYVNYNKAHKLLNNLLDGGVIETDNHYRVGNKSKYYKITEKLNSKWKLEEIEDIALKAKIKKAISSKTVLDGQDHVTECMKNLKINVAEALHMINLMDISEEQKEYWTMQVEMFENKFSVVDQKGFRLHNNLTNLASPLRALLVGSNGLLSQIDIKCSQPTFLALKTSKIESIDLEERQRILKICEEGIFYEYLFEKEAIDSSLRKDFKTRVFSELLFNKNYKRTTEVEALFKKKFPSIFRYIVESKEDNYKDFPIMLQRQESEFIFSVVSKLKHLEVFTVHDSIITCKSCIEEVKQEMCKQFKEIYNFSPKLVVENLEMSK